jgi:hypothetical protein
MNGYFLWFYEEEKIGQTGLDFRREKYTEIKGWKSKEIEMNTYVCRLFIGSTLRVLNGAMSTEWFCHEANIEMEEKPFTSS